MDFELTNCVEPYNARIIAYLVRCLFLDSKKKHYFIVRCAKPYYICTDYTCVQLIHGDII